MKKKSTIWAKRRDISYGGLVCIAIASGGGVMIDSTGSVSMIHLTSTYTDISGWIDLANLEEYVPDYKDSGLEGVADTDKMDALISNINHAG